MLRFADELLLLLIDDRRGDLIPVPEWSLSCALAGAVLMDLALEDRIDTDPQRLMLLDATPLGDDLLDPVLEEIARSDATHPARFWVAHVAEQGEDIRDRALARLEAQGILEVEEGGGLAFMPSVSRTRRYPTDEGLREDVQLRIMRAIFGRDIPDPRDAVIIGLADACGVFERSASLHRAHADTRTHRPAGQHGPDRPRGERDHRATAAGGPRPRPPRAARRRRRNRP